MIGAGATLWGCDQRQTDDRNRREVSNEKCCHRYLQPAWNDAGGTGEKLCPTSQRRLRVKWNYSRPGQALALCTYAVPRPENYFLYVAKSLMWLAPRAGFEPATNRLTVVLAS